MKSYRMTLLLAALATAGFSGASQAAGTYYGTAMIGNIDQAEDSEAFGNNLAVDSTFPDQFSTGDGTVGTLGIGYSLNNAFRVEGRLGFHDSDFNSRKLGAGERAGEEFILDGTLKSTTLTVEGFYDISTRSALKPYLKAGLGASRNSYSARLGGTGVADFDPFDGNTDGFYDAYADKKSTEFTWNVGAGARYAINNRVNLLGEYQYVSFGEAKTGADDFTDGFEVDAAAHEVQLGLTVDF